MGQDGVLCRSGWRGAHHVMRKAHCIWIPAWEYFLSSPSFAIKFIVSALRSVQTVSICKALLVILSLEARGVRSCRAGGYSRCRAESRVSAAVPPVPA